MCSYEPGKYHNEKYKFSINFPQDWKVIEGEHGTVVMGVMPANNDSGIFKENINIIVDLLDNNVNVKEYVGHQISEMKRLMKVTILENGNRVINNEQAQWFIYSYGIREYGIKAMVYVFCKNHRGYIITCISDIQTFDIKRQKFEKIAYSFKFDK